MKSVFVVIAATCLMCGAALAAGKKAKDSDEMYVVRVTAHNDSVTNKLMTPAEFSALEQQAKAEEKYFDKALEAAEKEWKSGEVNKGKSFPKGAISKLKVKVVAKYTDMTKASDRIISLEEKAREKIKEDEKRQNEQYDKQKLTESQRNEKKRKQAELDGVRSLAVMYFEGQLSALMSAAGPATSSDAAKDGKKEEAKK